MYYIYNVHMYLYTLQYVTEPAAVSTTAVCPVHVLYMYMQVVRDFVVYYGDSECVAHTVHVHVSVHVQACTLNGQFSLLITFRLRPTATKFIQVKIF